MKYKAEADRLKILDSFSIMDTPSEHIFDKITRTAAHVTKMPIVLLSLLDEKRQWFKSKFGLNISETPREIAFCHHAIKTPHQPLHVADATKDQRFANNPLVTGPAHIRFYYGVPLVSMEGAALGTFCVIHPEVIEFSAEAAITVKALSHLAMTQLEVRRQREWMRKTAKYLKDTIHDEYREDRDAAPWG